jgi:phosphoribosylglycinamide formyltransferase 1
MLTSVPIAVLVSGSGTNLQALLDAQGTGKLHSGRIVLVISDRPDAYALKRAQDCGVEAMVFNRQILTASETEKSILQALQDRKIGLVVLAGFLTILSPAFIKAFKHPIINVHPSLLPSFGGKGFWGIRVHQAALARGVKISGATVHLVNEEPDGGPILLQKSVPVRKGDTPESLQRRVLERAEWVLLPRCAERMCKGISREVRNAGKA